MTKGIVRFWSLCQFSKYVVTVLSLYLLLSFVFLKINGSKNTAGADFPKMARIKEVMGPSIYHSEPSLQKRQHGCREKEKGSQALKEGNRRGLDVATH